jgi:Ca-activated chloride channel family protein
MASPSQLLHVSTAIALVLTQPLLAQQPFKLTVRTQEVALSFHAEDGAGNPIDNLTANDMLVRDDGKPAEKITRFLHNTNLPVRAVIVFDMSASMQGAISPRRMAQQLASTVLQSSVDQAMIVRFDFETQVQQDWTSDKQRLMAAAVHVTDQNGSRLGGTALWDTLYRVCRDHIPAQVPGSEVSANAILLFTDGVDNVSHALPEDVVDECSQRETSIYPFVIDDRAHFDAGQKALRLLAERTGGRVFYDQNVAGSAQESILQINKELRDRYTLVYRPRPMKLDGSFRSVKLECPRRAVQLSVRDGYFASR